MRRFLTPLTRYSTPWIVLITILAGCTSVQVTQSDVTLENGVERRWTITRAVSHMLWPRKQTVEFDGVTNTPSVRVNQ